MKDLINAFLCKYGIHTYKETQEHMTYRMLIEFDDRKHQWPTYFFKVCKCCGKRQYRERYLGRALDTATIWKDMDIHSEKELAWYKYLDKREWDRR
jgi:hypothetical protein